MKKHITSLFLALSMVFSMCVPTLAAERQEAQIDAEIASMEEEIYAEVYRQLEAQNGLHMMDTYKAILAPKIRAAVEEEYGIYSPASVQGSVIYHAPNGGRAHYTQVGLTEVDEYYMSEESTRDFLEINKTFVTFLEVARAAYGVAFAGKWQAVAAYSFTTMLIAMESIPRTAIENCGHAYIIVTYEPTTPATYNVVLAWSKYPTVNIDNRDIVDGPTFEHYTG